MSEPNPMSQAEIDAFGALTKGISENPKFTKNFLGIESEDKTNPSHYKQHPSGVECIQITEHMRFNLGNAVKYIWRCDEKHDSPVEDLQKAIWYLQREIKRIENENKK